MFYSIRLVDYIVIILIFDEHLTRESLLSVIILLDLSKPKNSSSYDTYEKCKLSNLRTIIS